MPSARAAAGGSRVRLGLTPRRRVRTRRAQAPGAAGTIHTDFERGFIMAEVMHYEDWAEAGSEAQAKATGKYMQKGKEYLVEDGDICYFKFNVSATRARRTPARAARAARPRA